MVRKRGRRSTGGLTPLDAMALSFLETPPMHLPLTVNHGQAGLGGEEGVDLQGDTLSNLFKILETLVRSQ